MCFFLRIHEKKKLSFYSRVWGIPKISSVFKKKMFFLINLPLNPVVSHIGSDFLNFLVHHLLYPNYQNYERKQLFPWKTELLGYQQRISKKKYKEKIPLSGILLHDYRPEKVKCFPYFQIIPRFSGWPQDLSSRVSTTTNSYCITPSNFLKKIGWMLYYRNFSVFWKKSMIAFQHLAVHNFDATIRKHESLVSSQKEKKEFNFPWRATKTKKISSLLRLF